MLFHIKALVKNLICILSPELYSRYLFQRILGKKLDLQAPKGLNAKLMWLKLNRYDKDPLVTQCADKYAVRQYVEACGCGDILNELYGVWDRAADIPWDELPEAFVLKCNHGCGYNLICPDKSAVCIREAEERLNEWLGEEYWLRYAELQYRDIPHRIICERMLGDGVHMPYDYKIYCFHGEPEYILMCMDRKTCGEELVAIREKPKFFFFDTAWNLCRITNDGLHAPQDFKVEKPGNLQQLLEISKKLSKPFPFVRVDLYDIMGTIVFGELTFTPSGALDAARLPETDLKFGELLTL